MSESSLTSIQFFIYHKGGEGFDSENRILKESRSRFTDKWGFDIWLYELFSDDIIDYLENTEPDHDKAFSVLEVFSGLGANLSRIKWLYPNSYTAGIEISPLLAGISRFCADRIICDNILSADRRGKKNSPKGLPLPKAYFDYIIIDFDSFDDETAGYLKKLLTPYLSKKGKFIT